MSSRVAKRVKKGLAIRTAAWDALSIDQRKGTTRPGSLNRKRSPQGSTHRSKKKR